MPHLGTVGRSQREIRQEIRYMEFLKVLFVITLQEGNRIATFLLKY